MSTFILVWCAIGLGLIFLRSLVSLLPDKKEKLSDTVYDSQGRTYPVEK